MSVKYKCTINISDKTYLALMSVKYKCTINISDKTYLALMSAKYKYTINISDKTYLEMKIEGLITGELCDLSCDYQYLQLRVLFRN